MIAYECLCIRVLIKECKNVTTTVVHIITHAELLKVIGIA